jgi:penicillin-binding protein 1A
VQVRGEWFFDNHVKQESVSNVDLSEPPTNNPVTPPTAVQTLPPADEKKRILDLFKE